jgi:hypothetical protein
MFLGAIGSLFVGLCSVTLADSPIPEASKLLPTNVGTFRQVAPVKVLDRESMGRIVKSMDDIPRDQLYDAATEYASADGEKLSVDLIRFENDSAAFSRFTFIREAFRGKDRIISTTPGVGTASVLTKVSLSVFKGASLLSVSSTNGKDQTQAVALGQLLAAGLDSGEGEIPVLVKHLPNWEATHATAIYLVNGKELAQLIPNQPILNEINFDGGTEAVTASYGSSQLLLVEFTTPQFSIDTDQRIWTKYAELKSQNQPVPTAYRRVGNYSVFVFNAPDDKTANQLIDQVKYEQVVQWLGDDPHLYERLQKYFTQTSAGVLIAVLKSSGLSLLFCLVAGALIGTFLFRHRRTQRAALYSDAGGAVRLNLDDLTAPSKSRRLLNQGQESKPDSH